MTRSLVRAIKNSPELADADFMALYCGLYRMRSADFNVVCDALPAGVVRGMRSRYDAIIASKYAYFLAVEGGIPQMDDNEFINFFRDLRIAVLFWRYRRNVADFRDFGELLSSLRVRAREMCTRFLDSDDWDLADALYA